MYVYVCMHVRGPECCPSPPALSVGSNRLFQVLDLYLRSPESADVWSRSMRLKTAICSGSRTPGWQGKCSRPTAAQRPSPTSRSHSLKHTLSHTHTHTHSLSRTHTHTRQTAARWPSPTSRSPLVSSWSPHWSPLVSPWSPLVSLCFPLSPLALPSSALVSPCLPLVSSRLPLSPLVSPWRDSPLALANLEVPM